MYIYIIGNTVSVQISGNEHDAAHYLMEQIQQAGKKQDLSFDDRHGTSDKNEVSASDHSLYEKHPLMVTILIKGIINIF